MKYNQEYTPTYLELSEESYVLRKQLDRCYMIHMFIHMITTGVVVVMAFLRGGYYEDTCGL